jgi:hypothetical protein
MMSTPVVGRHEPSCAAIASGVAALLRTIHAMSLESALSRGFVIETMNAVGSVEGSRAGWTNERHPQSGARRTAPRTNSLPFPRYRTGRLIGSHGPAPNRGIVSVASQCSDISVVSQCSESVDHFSRMGVHWPVDRGDVAAIKQAPRQMGLTQGMQCHCERSKRFASVRKLRTGPLCRSRIPPLSPSPLAMPHRRPR